MSLPGKHHMKDKQAVPSICMVSTSCVLEENMLGEMFKDEEFYYEKPFFCVDFL